MVAKTITKNARSVIKSTVQFDIGIVEHIGQTTSSAPSVILRHILNAPRKPLAILPTASQQRCTLICANHKVQVLNRGPRCAFAQIIQDGNQYSPARLRVPANI